MRERCETEFLGEVNLSSEVEAAFHAVLTCKAGLELDGRARAVQYNNTYRNIAIVLGQATVALWSKDPFQRRHSFAP